MRLSIVSAYYNKEDMTRDFLDNLQKVSPPDVEMILTNAGSQPIDHPFVTKRVDLDHNESFSNSMNAALKVATGDYVCLLGNDVFPSEGWLEKLVKLAEDTGAFITSPVNDKTPLHMMQGKQFDTYFETDMFPAVCWLLSRECLDSIGLFDERFLGGCYEDNDYARRVKDAGGKIVVDKTTSVGHLLSQTIAQFDIGALMQQNYDRYHQKWS